MSETDNTSAWHAPWAWLGGEAIAKDVRIEAARGVITSVTEGTRPTDAERLGGLLIPGLVNAHSHAFHRLLRGRTHSGSGDFWRWREMMYEVAGKLKPESYEQVATAVFMEMAMAGVTTVGEFHYLHHQDGGAPYFDPNEMGHSLIRAARAVGFRIGLLDTGYFRGGFDSSPLDNVQTRFRDESGETWLQRASALSDAYESAFDVVVGLAPHSVRAVPVEVLHLVGSRPLRSTKVHIHVSEQPAENADCLAATGLTPTAVLSRSSVLGPETTLVHATHLTKDDMQLIADSESTVCYCATTERDLADGLGPSGELADRNVRLSVGTDSHAVIDLFEEARGIELHNRLATGKRGRFTPGELLESATTHGADSLGFPSGGLSVGSPADFVVVDLGSPRLAGADEETLLASVAYSATSEDIVEVYVGGDRIVADGHHPGWESAKTALETWWK